MKTRFLLLAISLICMSQTYAQFEQVYPQEFVSSIDIIEFHDSGLGVAVLECDGILRSTDNGDTWVYIEILGLSSQNNLLFIDGDPDHILISGSYAAYESLDGGLSFQSFSYQSIPTEGLRKSIIQLENGDFVFLARTASAMSKDLITWTKLAGFPAFSYALNGSTVFSTAGKSLIRSLDNLNTYDTIFVFPTNILGIDYNDGVLLVALLDNTTLKSLDNGQSFLGLSTPISGTSNPHVFDKNNYAFFNNNRVGITTDGGLSFETISYSPTNINGFKSYGIRSDGKMFVVGESLKMITSDDKGMTWNLIQGRYESFNNIGAKGTSVAVCGNEGSIVFSKDGGKTWQDIAGTRTLIVAVMPVSEEEIYYVDNDKNGHLINDVGVEMNSFAFPNSVTSLQFENGVLYAVLSGSNGEIYISNDRGGNWAKHGAVNDQIINLDIIATTEWIVTSNSGKIYISENGGVSWDLLFDFEGVISQGSFKNRNEGVWFNYQKMYGTDDGFVTVQEIGKPYNALKLIREGDKMYCLGANSSNTYMYEFTGLLANKGLKSGCVSHQVIGTVPNGVIIAGRGGVIERFDNTPTGIKDVENQSVDQLNVFPNPANESITIMNLPIQSEVSVFDAFGRKVNSKMYLNTISITDLNSGVYYIKAVKDGIMYKGGFVKI